jgi:hypothetical protein
MRWRQFALTRIAGLATAITIAAIARADETSGSVRGTLILAGHPHFV